MVNRRESRELALQILFHREFIGSIELNNSLSFFKQSFDFAPAVWDYTMTLLTPVVKDSQDIDRRIDQVSDNWKTHRMSLVDLNILRLAVIELGLGTAPPKVVINEALEIARKYSSTDSPVFINGILDHFLNTKDD